MKKFLFNDLGPWHHIIQEQLGLDENLESFRISLQIYMRKHIWGHK